MMSFSDKPWNNNNTNPGFNGPPTFPGRPTFPEGNGNIHLQNPRNPQMGPSPHQQFQNYSNMPRPPSFTHNGNSLYVPRHSQFQNPPPPLRLPIMTFSNPTVYQGFSAPLPNHGVHIQVQPLPASDAQSSLQNVDMKYGPPPLPSHASFSSKPTHPPFLHNLPHRFSADHIHSPGTDYGAVTQHKGINDCQGGIRSGRQQLDDRELGAQKLDRWLQKVGRSKRPHLKDSSKQEPSKQIQLWESISQLRDLTQLIIVMSDKVKEMDNCASSANNVTWKNMTGSLETLKDKFINLEPVLGRPSVQNIERKLFKIHHKRARLRRARVFKFEEEQRLSESWVEKSKQIDKWQERHRTKIKEEFMRKSRKAAADCTLSKVSREIQDATRLIDTMLGLQKLRLIRRDAAQKRGDTDLGESRQTFDQKIVDMTRLVQSQLECYKEEEAKLKQVIKSEQEEDTEKEKLLQMEKEQQKQREENEEMQTKLFGPMDKITESDPLFPYVQFYKQAENSLQTFVQIRHEWDSFLVPENTPTSSVIPSSWILPEPPSSATWASALNNA